MVAEAFNADQEQLCLIFAGKILRDADTLKSHSIKKWFDCTFSYNKRRHVLKLARQEPSLILDPRRLV